MAPKFEWQYFIQITEEAFSNEFAQLAELSAEFP